MNDVHPYPADPIRVIHVSGDDRSIGRQHAEAVGQAANLGMPKFYFEMWERLLANRPKGWIEQSLYKGLVYLIDPLLLHRLTAHIPNHMRERLLGVAEVTGKPYQDLAKALVLPDLMPMLQAYLVKIRPSMFIKAAPPLRMGCSSFVSSGKNFLHGRNLDFPGVAYWDRFPVIQMTQRKNCMKYIGFTTAGVPLAGITGINEAQISVSLHQHYCLDTSLKGALPFITAEEILARATSIRDVISVLRESPVATSWAFIVTDGKTREAFIYECHPNACGVRFLQDSDNVLAHSNFFQSQECRPKEYATTARMNWDNYWRKTRLEALIKGAGDSLTVQEAAQFISDQFDGFWQEEKIVNRTVSQVYNIQSLIIDSEKMRVWMAEGNSPIHLRRYREFDLGEIFASRSSDSGSFVTGYRFVSQERRSAKEAYILSFVAAFNGDYQTALREMEHCLNLDFCPEAAQVAGIMYMKVGQEERAKGLFEGAKEMLEKKVQNVSGRKFPPEYFEVCLYLARVNDLLGKRNEALALYQMIRRHTDLEDDNLRSIAEKEGPYSEKKLSRIVMPFSSYIPFE